MTKKGAMSISDYFVKMEGITDRLFLASCEIANEELIIAVLTGWPEE